MERPNAWLSYSEADMNQLEDVAKKYRHFLNVGKTERECIELTVNRIEKAGYRDLNKLIEAGESLNPGGGGYNELRLCHCTPAWVTE